MSQLHNELNVVCCQSEHCTNRTRIGKSTECAVPTAWDGRPSAGDVVMTKTNRRRAHHTQNIGTKHISMCITCAVSCQLLLRLCAKIQNFYATFWFRLLRSVLFMTLVFVVKVGDNCAWSIICGTGVESTVFNKRLESFH